MKNNSLFITLVIVVFVFTNLILLYCFNIQKRREELLINTIEEQEKKLYNLFITQIESGIIQNKLIPTGILEKKRFVIVFPNNACDICNTWFFEQLKKCERLDKIDVIVPFKMKKTMSVYNEIYDLNLINMKYSDDYLLNSENDIYIFYYSGEGNVSYPFILKEKFFNLNIYMDIVCEQNEV